MAKKTNRTSHVMDLLTNGASGEAPETVSEAPASGQEKKSDVQSHTVTPAKVTVVDEGSINDRVSQEILGQLTEELEAEKKEQAAAPEQSDPQTVQAEEAAQQDTSGSSETDGDAAPQAPEADSHAADEADSSQADTEAPQAPPAPAEAAGTVPAAASAPQAPETSEPQKQPHPIIPESHFSSHTQNREYRFINVMEQLLMRQDLDAVLKQHNVCTCPRCMTDVCALTLTGLPPKYVVTSKDSISPLLSYYENKYKIPILTELMKACSKVRESPRHKKTN